MALTVGSLFSGIGGIDLGLERAGMESRWFVEWDAHCQNVLRRHWPGLPVYGDITKVDWRTVEPVDVLAGGFPCQPVSNAGKRLGTEDDRWLWPEFARAIRVLEPRYVLVENVAALLGRGFEHVITDLAALGYDAEWDCIPAAAVGAPHLRDRLWIVAYPKRRSPQPIGSAGDVPRAARGTEGASPQRQRGRDAARDRGEVVADSTREREREQADEADPIAGGRQARHEPGDGRQPLADADGIGLQGERRGGLLDGIGQARRGDANRRGSAPVQNSIFAGLEGHERGVVALSEYRRSNADPAGSGWWSVEPDMGRVADGIPHRVDRLRSLGNAVVPQVVEFIGRRIVAFDAGEAVAA